MRYLVRSFALQQRDHLASPVAKPDMGLKPIAVRNRFRVEGVE